MNKIFLGIGGYLCFVLPFLVFISGIISCKNHNASPLDETKYIAHIKLDSSILVLTEVAGDLDVPWEITLGSDGFLWFTEQKGRVIRMNPETGEMKVLLQLSDIHYMKSRGLLGMAVHPDLRKEPYVYLHYTFSFFNDDKFEEIQSRLVRYTYSEDSLQDRLILLDSIPGKSFHNGSRLVISTDNKLYFSLGDIGEPSKAQNVNYTSGKILRFNLDGSIPDDNPFTENPVWAWGFRNPQGLVIASNGQLYASDHGANNDDEVNLILKGRNYGWPDVQGYCDLEQEIRYCNDSAIVAPLASWTPTLAVAGLDYYSHDNIPEWNNSLLLVNMKGRAMRLLQLNDTGDAVIKEKIFFQKIFGRLRDIAVSPNGDIYLSTSNRDWHPRYQPFMYDSLPEGGDRIIKIQKASPSMISQLEKFPGKVELHENTEPMELFSENWEYKPTEEHLVEGQKVYIQHCAACHRPDGEGVQDLIPPLAGTDWVTGDKSRLIHILLRGLSDPITVNGKQYDQEMPSFSHLSDEDIANVLTFIRESFGNKAGAVISGEVFEERKGL